MRFDRSWRALRSASFSAAALRLGTVDVGSFAALAGVVVRLLHVRLEMGDHCFHRLGGLQHERQLHLPGAEQFASANSTSVQ